MTPNDPLSPEARERAGALTRRASSDTTRMPRAERDALLSALEARIEVRDPRGDKSSLGKPAAPLRLGGFAANPIAAAIVAGTMGIAIGAVGGYLAGRDDALDRSLGDATAPAATSSETTSSRRSALESAAPAPTLTPAATIDSGTTPRDASAPREPAERSAGTLRAEQSWVQTARTALERGDARAARVALEQHATRFPMGQLSEERESLFVQTLVALGESDEARTRASRFRARYPDSMLQGVVDDAIRHLP